MAFRPQGRHALLRHCWMRGSTSAMRPTGCNAPSPMALFAGSARLPNPPRRTVHEGGAVRCGHPRAWAARMRERSRFGEAA